MRAAERYCERRRRSSRVPPPARPIPCTHAVFHCSLACEVSQMGDAFGVLMSAARPAKRHKAEPRSSGESSFALCPLCSASFHPKLLPAHAESCSGPPEAQAKPLPTPNSRGAVVKTQLVSPATGIPVIPVKSSQPLEEKPTGPGSAFAVLLAAQGADNLGCFYLRHDAATGLLSAHWQRAPPAQPAWRCSLDVQGGKDKAARRRGVITLAADLPSAYAAYAWPTHVWPTAPTASVLKSAVQKNVRLCRPAAAVRAAAALLCVDASDGLRRLAVIAVEDAAADAHVFPILVWAMAALSKRYEAPPQLWAAVLRGVHALAALPLRDTEAVSNGMPELTLFSPVLGASPPEGSLMARSLLLRAHFGGMKGDVHMLRDAAAVWRWRYSDEAPPGGGWPAKVAAAFASLPPAEHVQAAAAAARPPHMCAALMELECVPPLRGGDVPYSALDQHCSRLIDDVMADARLTAEQVAALDATGEEQDSALRHMVWIYRSSLSNKVPAAEPPAAGPLHAAWLLLEPLIDLHQRRLHARALAKEHR